MFPELFPGKGAGLDDEEKRLTRLDKPVGFLQLLIALVDSLPRFFRHHPGPLQLGGIQLDGVKHGVE